MGNNKGTEAIMETQVLYYEHLYAQNVNFDNEALKSLLKMSQYQN
jgi:hypothetical protein